MYNSFYFCIYLRVKLLFIQFSLLNSSLSWVGIKRYIIKMQVLTCISRSGIGLRVCICMKTVGDADATWQWILPWIGMIVVVQSISFVWSLWPHGLQHASSPLSHRIYSNSYLLSRWCHSPISSSAAPFYFCLQSFSASRSFPMSCFVYQVARVLELQL